jgi:hypothetical protein
MAFLSRDQVKALTEKALHTVADFNGDIDTYSFQPFHDFHKMLFFSHLKKVVCESPYYDKNGSTSFDRFYDVALNNTIINKWKTIKDCIDYIEQNQAVRPRPVKLQF